MRTFLSVVLWIFAALAPLVYKLKNGKMLKSVWLAQHANKICTHRKRVINFEPDRQQSPFYLAQNIGLVWCGAKGAASKEWKNVLEKINGAPLKYVWNMTEPNAVLNTSKKLLTVRSPASRLASAWIESPLSPPGQDGDDFSSLLRFIIHEKKMHRNLHSRLSDITSTCRVCDFNYDIIWKEEDGELEANEIIKSISGHRSNVVRFPSKEIHASNCTTEKLLGQISKKLHASINNLYKSDAQLFRY